MTEPNPAPAPGQQESKMAMNVLSIFSAALGLVGFIETQIPDNLHLGEHSTLRVQVGLAGPNPNKTTEVSSQMDGTVPLVLAFNENGDWIGHSDRHDKRMILDGSFEDLVVIQDRGPGQQATYLQVIARNNAICVAFLTQTWADGSHRGWVGDYGAYCGMDWFPSNIIIGQNYKPSE